MTLKYVKRGFTMFSRHLPTFILVPLAASLAVSVVPVGQQRAPPPPFSRWPARASAEKKQRSPTPSPSHPGKKKRLTASEAANGTRMNVGRWRENMVKPRLTYLSVTSEYR